MTSEDHHVVSFTSFMPSPNGMAPKLYPLEREESYDLVTQSWGSGVLTIRGTLDDLESWLTQAQEAVLEQRRANGN